MQNINQKSPAWLTNILSGVVVFLISLVAMKEDILGLATSLGLDAHLPLITKIFTVIASVLAIVKMFFSKIADNVVQSIQQNKK